MGIRRLLTIAAVLSLLFAGMAGGRPEALANAQTTNCAGLPAYSQAMLAEEQRYTDQMKATLDLDDLRAIAAATPAQLTGIVEIIDRHLKNLDAIAPPAFAEDWHMAIAEEGDLSQALFADAALNGVFTVLVDYYDQSIRSDREIANAGVAATAICADFDAFATEFDLIDGSTDSPAPGHALWSHCAGLDDLGIAIDRANLQGLVDAPAAIHPLIAFAEDWDIDPSLGWNPFDFYNLADYYEAVAQHLETVTPPVYAVTWFQSVIDFDRAVGEVIRGAFDQGIMAASAAGGDQFIAIDQAASAGIELASQSCAEFDQFAEEYG